MYEYKHKTHYRDNKKKPLRSYCGKEPPRYKNIILTNYKKRVTCSHCKKKLAAFKKGQPKKLVRMHPDWELPSPDKSQVLAAATRGIESRDSYMVELDKRIAANSQIKTGRKA